MHDKIKLPDEVLALLSGGEDTLDEGRLAALSQAIAKLRDDAVEGRRASGIEDNWRESEEQYLGIDDENRHEFEGQNWAKPVSMEGGLEGRRRRNSSDEVRATAYVRMTARYVDAGTAKVGEVALSIDGKDFSLKATPVPEQLDAVKDKAAVMVGGQPVLRPPEPPEAMLQERAPQPGQPPMQGGAGQPQAPEQLTVADLAKHAIQEAEERAKRAETRIYDWMVEYNHGAEMRKVIFDGARCGSGVIKGPILEERTGIKYESAGRLTIVKSSVPAARWVDFWNLYPDPECGEDIHDGEYVFERDTMLPSKLRKLGESAGAGWIPTAVEKVIKEGPGKNSINENGGPRARDKEKKRSFVLWHCYGQIKRKDLAAANPGAADDAPGEDEDIFAIVTLVNDTVVRAVLNPLESGRFPYHVFNWRRRAGHWAGVGIGEQVRNAQRALNAGWRSLLDNAGQSAGTNIVMDPDSIEPANKSWVLGGRNKLWWKLAKATGVGDIRTMFSTFDIPNKTKEMLLVMEQAEKQAEDACSIPLISQGQSGDTTPDTFGGQQLQDNNANQLLRDVSFGLHDTVTDPLVKGFYEWLLLDPSVPDDEKGDMQVDISGAAALIEKAMQRTVIMKLGALIGLPGSRLSREKWEESLLRTWRMVPSDFQLSDADWEKLQATPPQQAPAVQAAEIRAQSAEKIAQSSDQLDAQRNQNDLDRDTAYNTSLANRDQIMANLKVKELELKVRLAELQVQADERISLQEAKVKLADTTMKLQVQKDLSGMDGKGPQVVAPPDEPPGRAPNGEAYQA